MLAALSLGACATEDYVNQQVAGVQSQVTEHGGRIGALETKTNAHEAHLAKLDEDTAAATKLAAGKFGYQAGGTETVSFQTGSAAISDEEQAKLNALASRLKADDKNVYLEIEGYADPRGGRHYNYHLAVDRAVAVYDYLRDQGVALNRMDIASHGEEHPKGETKTAQGLAQNRVVVISMVQ